MEQTATHFIKIKSWVIKWIFGDSSWFRSRRQVEKLLKAHERQLWKILQQIIWVLTILPENIKHYRRKSYIWLFKTIFSDSISTIVLLVLESNLQTNFNDYPSAQRSIFADIVEVFGLINKWLKLCIYITVYNGNKQRKYNELPNQNDVLL